MAFECSFSPHFDGIFSILYKYIYVNQINCINNSMKQLLAYKYRIYPTEDQQILLSKTFGCKRVIFNHYLNVQQTNFKNKEKHLSNYDINRDITKLKDEKDWLREVDSIALQMAAEDLSLAYDNFFKSTTGKRKGPKIAAPKFKTKNSRQSYRTRGVRINENGSLQIPKLKAVEAVIHREIPGDSTIKSTTISKNTDGRYYASILVETEVALKPTTGREVGCDVGLKDLLITSDGIKFKRPNDLLNIVKTKQLLKAKQKQFARTDKGSENHESIRLQVARLYSKITRQRNEYYHLVSNYLVDNYDSIYVEDLSSKNMLQNRKLSRAIHEAAWATLTGMISYKSNQAGRTYHRISRWYPSSKTCSSCNYKLEKLDLGTREWTCPNCGVFHDRDLNAAKNILRVGQIDCYEEVIESQATGDLELKIPLALQKMTSKIERSGICLSVGYGSGQAARSLVVQ
jgi:putative transposase